MLSYIIVLCYALVALSKELLANEVELEDNKLYAIQNDQDKTVRSCFLLFSLHILHILI